MENRIWPLFCEIREEAFSGYPNCRFCDPAYEKWKAALSAFRFEFIPLLAAPELSADDTALWQNVSECVPWIYRALERPRKKLPKSWEPELQTLQKTLIRLGCNPAHPIDNTAQVQPAAANAAVSIPIKSLIPQPPEFLS